MRAVDQAPVVAGDVLFAIEAGDVPIERRAAVSTDRGVTLLERNGRIVRLADAGDGISYEGCEAARSGRERCCRQSG
jgi:hypothetical protein